LFLGEIWQNLSVLGKFGQIWANAMVVEMAVAKSMPLFERKIK
jgi:hypothetical protein